MPELALPQNFQDATPVLDIIEIGESVATSPSFEFELYTTEARYTSRIRYCLINGRDVAGTVGALSASLEAYPPGGNGVLGAPSLHNIAAGDHRTYTWSTEVGVSYSGSSPNFADIDMLALPLVALPGGTRITFETGALAGGDEIWDLIYGYLHIERFAPDTLAGLGGQGQLAEVYLLPQAF